MKFKGISLDNTIEDFLKELEKKGGHFPIDIVNGKSVPDLDEGEIDIYGKLAGYEFEGKASYTLISHKVYSIDVTLTGLNIPSKFFLKQFVDKYIKKYGKPNEVEENGDEYYNWNYRCAFYVDDGSINLSCNSETNCPSLLYIYVDNLNLADKEREKVLLDEI